MKSPEKGSIFIWLSIVALILAVPRGWPYGYYTLLRFLICGTSTYHAYLSFQKNKRSWTIIFSAIALVFNPFIKVYFKKDDWAVVDMLTAIIFFVYGIRIILANRQKIKE